MPHLASIERACTSPNKFGPTASQVDDQRTSIGSAQSWSLLLLDQSVPKEGKGISSIAEFNGENPNKSENGDVPGDNEAAEAAGCIVVFC